LPDTSGVAGTIAAGPVLGLITLARARGLDVRPLFDLTGLAPDATEARVPVTTSFTALAHVARELDEPGLPICMAESARIEDLDLFGFLVMTSTSGREAFERMVQYFALVSDSIRWSFEVQGDAVAFTGFREGPRTLGHRLGNECGIAHLLRGIHVVSGRSVIPRVVRFAHRAPRNTSAHQRFFRAPIEWGCGEDMLVMPATVLEHRSPAANADLGAYLEAQARDRIRDLVRTPPLSAQVRETIARELPSGLPAMPRIARRLGTSERTLRRHLEDEGTSFRAQVDAVRKDRAQTLLSERDASLGDIALALGFSDASAFSRAFRRWFGRPPTRR
jgi:AraC-like DNA-binding protein